jgi:hypothetical protein
MGNAGKNIYTRHKAAFFNVLHIDPLWSSLNMSSSCEWPAFKFYVMPVCIVQSSEY